MLSHVRVQNIALMDEVEIDFQEGLNVITGETGAGKSILLGALSLALGGRNSKDVVRDQSRPAEVVLQFYEENSEVLKALEEMGIECEDQELLIARRFSGSGRSQIYLNDRQVTAAQVKKAATVLIDVHGQHEHQSLLNQKAHIDLLDRFIPEMPQLLKLMEQKYEDLRKLSEEYESFRENAKDRLRLLSLMNFELQEIEDADLKEDEEETLKEERKKLFYAGRIKDSLNEAYTALSGDDYSSSGAMELLENAYSALESAEKYDEAFSREAMSSLMEIESLMDEAAKSIRSHADTIEEDPERLSELEERYDLIQKMKQKYGQTVAEIDRYYEKTKIERDRLENAEETMALLERQLKEREEETRQLADQMSKLRQQAGGTISREITDVLSTLEFDDPLFEVQIEEKEIGPKGRDKVTFMIRTNKGEEVKPLNQIASGGEMSRVMLSIKTVLAAQDRIPTLIFDEIDTGISGRTAQSVAEKMSRIALSHQVIAVTHLPQIAAMADAHLRIEKSSETGHAVTHVSLLEGDEITTELARMLGGTVITEAVLTNAQEMKNLATEWKRKQRNE